MVLLVLWLSSAYPGVVLWGGPIHEPMSVSEVGDSSFIMFLGATFGMNELNKSGPYKN